MPNKLMAKLLLCCVFSTGILMAQDSESYPLLIHAELPTYHPVARIARVQGTVKIKVTIKAGEVVSAEGVSGPPMLLKSSIDNVETWRFSRESNASFIVTFIYKIEGSETKQMRNPRIEADLPTMINIIAPPTMPPCNDCTTK